MDNLSEKEKITSLIKEAIKVLCVNGLTYNVGFALEGALQVITDARQRFHVDLNEVVGLTSEDLTSLKQELNIRENAEGLITTEIMSSNIHDIGNSTYLTKQYWYYDTQSHKKYTVNSFASLVTQGQSQVTAACNI